MANANGELKKIDDWPPIAYKFGMSTNAPRLATRIWLASHGKTQAWLARELLMSDSLLSCVLNGWRRPSPDVVRRFLRVTGIDLARYPLNKFGCLSGAAPRDEPVPTPAPDTLPSA
jgi:hypothetical protein